MFSHFGMSERQSIHPMDDEAMYYYEKEDYESALEVVNNSINKEVATGLTYFILGKLYIEAGDAEKGEQYIERSYEMEPSNELIAKEKILEYRKVQDYESMDEAIAELKTPVEDPELKILVGERN